MDVSRLGANNDGVNLLVPFLQSRLTASLLLLLSAGLARTEAWSLRKAANIDGPGSMVLIQHYDQPVARLVYGEGQMKPYLHLYGENGELLTNPGLDEKGKRSGRFPHHRGLFIGWKIESDLGHWDLWHMNRGGDIRVVEVESAKTAPDHARLLTRNEWHAGKEDEQGSSLLLTEWRDITVSRPKPGQTQIDVLFRLKAARDLRLAGDLQHSGVHFRAANEVATRAGQTAYLHHPAGKTRGDDLAWCQLLFPIGSSWYTVTAMNAPSNPVEELSTRNYGRFGYFFRQELARDSVLPLRYRFLVTSVEAPADSGQRSEPQKTSHRQSAMAAYEQFLASLRP